MHYCPGCSHGVVHKLIAEVIEEMGLEDKAIGISPVGCAVFIYNYIDIDWQEAAHGRAPALATAIKRLWPDRLVFSYQGDGDLACIGTAETIHALNSCLLYTSYMRAEYVIEEIQRVLDVCDALEKDDYETVGQKMYETHHGMSKLYEVSCEELDFLNDLAFDCGVTGSRVMGCLLYTSK